MIGHTATGASSSQLAYLSVWEKQNAHTQTSTVTYGVKPTCVCHLSVGGRACAGGGIWLATGELGGGSLRAGSF